VEAIALAAGLRGLRGEDQSCIEVIAGFEDFNKLFQVLIVCILRDFKAAAQEAGAQAGLHQGIQKGGGNSAQRVGPVAPKRPHFGGCNDFKFRIFTILQRRKAVLDLRSRAGGREHDSDVGDMALRILDERNGSAMRRQLGRSDADFFFEFDQNASFEAHLSGRPDCRVVNAA
jgi:hypothetical protein